MARSACRSGGRLTPAPRFSSSSRITLVVIWHRQRVPVLERRHRVCEVDAMLPKLQQSLALESGSRAAALQSAASPRIEIAPEPSDRCGAKALIEAEAYEGPSLVIAYSHCIAHGIDITTGLQHQKAMVDAGQWLLYRYNPDRRNAGENPLQIDTRRITTKVEDFLRLENRFNQLLKGDEAEASAVSRRVEIDPKRGEEDPLRPAA